MRIVCWQLILMKYHTLFFSKFGKDVEKIVVCCKVKRVEGKKYNVMLAEHFISISQRV